MQSSDGRCFIILFSPGGNREDEGIRRVGWSKVGQGAEQSRGGRGARSVESSRTPKVNLHLELCPFKLLLRSCVGRISELGGRDSCSSAHWAARLTHRGRPRPLKEVSKAMADGASRMAAKVVPWLPHTSAHTCAPEYMHTLTGLRTLSPSWIWAVTAVRRRHTAETSFLSGRLSSSPPPPPRVGGKN